MKNNIGPQYDKDYAFKKEARLHQSEYRSSVLKADFDEYGNRLSEKDARSHLNYYPELNVIEELRKRFLNYSKRRDADMLRSEHIPFNMFAPLKKYPSLAQKVVTEAFGIECDSPVEILFEWAPKPKNNYLDDNTAFDTFIRFENKNNKKVGIGIEVKYTELGYRIGETEKKRVEDKNSEYWKVTKESGLFKDTVNESLVSDNLRQIWRNHLLGLSMQLRGDLDSFFSVILYPEQNKHFEISIPEYQSLLKGSNSTNVRGCTFENYISLLNGGEDIEKWRDYLKKRYAF